MKKLFIEEMKNYASLLNGDLLVNKFSAFLSYTCLIVGIIVFVLPKINYQTSLLSSVFYGGLFGLVTYGIFEFTSHALLKDWSIKLLLFDIIWGIIVCALVTLIMHYISKSLF